MEREKGTGNVKINKKIWLIGMILVFSIFFSTINLAYGAWWNYSYDYRQMINVSTSALSTEQNYQINLILNSSNVGSNFNWSDSCNDIRFINGSNNYELSYFIENCSISNQNASIWIKIPENITSSISNIYMYYKTSTPISKSNGSDTFDFFEDFSSDLSKWTKYKNTANINIVSGELNLSGGSTSAPYGHAVIGSNASYVGFLNGIIEGRVYLVTNTISEIGFRGNFITNTGYKSRIDARAGQGISHLKPPYNDGSWSFLSSCSVSGTAPSVNTWHDFRITVSGNSFNITTSGQNKICSDSSYTTQGEISLQNHYGDTVKYDDIRVRKYFSENIDVVLNAEEYKYLLVSSCQNLIADQWYLLAADISNAPNDCFIFTGDNIYFNGNGKTIDGVITGEAITTNNNGYLNLKIENTNINDFAYGIWIRNSENITIYNTTINNSNNYGIRSDFSGANPGNKNVNITQVSILNINTDDGIYVANNNNILFDKININTIGNGNGDHGIYLLTTDNINILNSNFTNTQDEAIRVDTFSNNILIQNILVNGTTYTGGCGVYLYNNIDNITIDNSSYYNLLDTAILGYQNITNLKVTNAYIENPRNRGIYCEDNGQYGCPNAIFKNILINGTQLSDGFYLDNSSNSVLDNLSLINIGNNDQGFEIYRTNNLSLINVNIQNISAECFYMSVDANNNLFENISMLNCGSDGFELLTDASNNQFRNINIQNVGNGDGIRTVTRAQNNSFENINIFNTTSDGIEMSNNITNTYMNNIRINLTGVRGIYLEDSNIAGADNSNFTNINISNVLTDDAFFVERADNSKFENITIENVGNGGTADYGLYFYLTSNARFNNIKILNSSSSFVGSTNSSYNNFSNIYIEDINNYYGIYLTSNSKYSRFENVTIKNTYSTGFLLDVNSSDNYIKNLLVISANGTTASDGLTMNANSADNSILININSENNGDYGIQLVGNNVYLQNITSKNNGDDGLYNNNLYQNITIINGTFENNQGYGIYLGTNSLYTKLRNIIVKNSGQDGIRVDGDSNNSIYQNIYVENSLNAGFDGMTVTGAYDSIFDNITIKNSAFYGLDIANSNWSNITNIYIENSSNNGFYQINSNNLIITNLTSNNNLYGVYSSQGDDSIFTNINTYNNSLDGLYFTLMDNSVITNITSRYNGDNGIYFNSGNNINISYSDFLYNVNTNYRVQNTNNIHTYLSWIGNDVISNNWGLNSLWNISDNSFALGNYYNNLVCTDSELYTYLSNLYQVCTLEDYTLNVANSRIDYGPLVNINYTQNISFVTPTPTNGSTQCSDCIYINISNNGSSSLQSSTFVDFDNSLMAWINFENISGGIAQDLSGHNNWGILRNNANQNSSNMKRGYNVELDGLNDYVEVQNLNHSIINKITLEAWIYPKTLNCVSAQDCTIINGGPASELQLTTNDNVDLRFCTQYAGGNCVTVPITNLIVNKWQHIVGTWNSTHCQLYIDGVLIGTNACNQITMPTSLFIGQHTAGLRAFDGFIDEVKLWNRTLSPIEINSSYNSNLYPLEVNITNLETKNYTFKACSTNFIGNVICTENREIIISNTSANVTVITPFNSSKYFNSETIGLLLNSTSTLSNVSYYLDFNLSNKTSMIDNLNNTYSENISNLAQGKHEITFLYYSGCGIEENKTVSFYVLQNYSSRVNKKITNINSDIYKIQLNITNNLNGNRDINPIDFLETRFNSGSFNIFYNFTNVSFGPTYVGDILGWNLDIMPTSTLKLNYSITKNTLNYNLLDEFIVGLD